MGFDEEVDEVGSHEPLDLLLDINRGNIREGILLFEVSKKKLKAKSEAIDLHLFHVSNNILNVCLTSLSG